MKDKNQTRILLSVAAAAALLTLAAPLAHGGTMSASTNAPGVRGYDIGNYGDVTGTDKWWNDSAPGSGSAKGETSKADKL